MALTFCAKAILLEKYEDGWKQKEVVINSVEELRGIFKPFEKEVSQINISKYLKVYFCVKFIKEGITAKICDQDGNMHYMVAPILLVECDDEKPVNISDSSIQTLLDTLDLY